MSINEATTELRGAIALSRGCPLSTRDRGGDQWQMMGVCPSGGDRLVVGKGGKKVN